MALENSILLENVTVVNGSVNLYDNELVNESMMIENNNVEENENPENDLLTGNNVEENENPENDLLKGNNVEENENPENDLLTGNNVEENENPENDLLKGLDSYMDDINDRLTVSRMVNDSVIKGMVSAIEQVSAEEIADKELELSRLKETLHLYLVGSEESESSRPLVMQHELGTAECGTYSSMSDALSDCERIGESLGSLKNVAKDQLKILRKDIDGIKGSCSMRRIGSGSEMVGLVGILQDKVSDIKWMDVDKTLDSLRATLGTICKHVDNLVCSSNASLCQWQQEKMFQAEIEDMVIMNCIQSLKEEFEERLWDESLNRLEKIKEISSLCQELNAISKSLSVPEMGPTTSHGSVEIGEEWDTNKRTDHLHRKISGNHASLSTSLLEGNGKRDEPVIAAPENLEYNQLKHMAKEELVNYFKAEMIKMKRNHEHKVQELTEECFSLKREYLKERGSFWLMKKDKEFDILRKKIPEVILKLDSILVENQKLPGYGMDAAGLSSLKDRLESLHRENHQLRSLLADRKREVKCLSSQVFDTAEMTLQHSLVKATLEKRIDNLICALDDAHIAVSITEDVYTCLLKEAVNCQKSSHEQSDMEYKIMQEVYEIIFREAADVTEPSTKCGFEDSDLESLIMQELCGVISAEALKEAKVELNELSLAYSNEMELRVSVEKEAMERERALRLEVAEMEGLKQETLLLSSLMEEKEKLANEAAAALVKEKELFELVSQELNNLRDETSRQQILISARDKEFGEMKDYLVKALVENELYKMEVYELKQELELAMKELRETNEEKRMLLSVSQQKQHVISLAEAKEREQSKQMQSLIVLIQGLSKAIDNFECRVMEDIKRSNSRLDGLSSQSRAVIQQAKDIKRMGLIYKQKLEKRSSDFQKAEAEVDLLGDEVDALLSLLEKIYIALDHYSPILQHYPGVIEILNLVKRELSGEFTKTV